MWVGLALDSRENWNHDYIKIHNFARFIFDSAIIKKTIPTREAQNRVITIGSQLF